MPGWRPVGAWSAGGDAGVGVAAARRVRKDSVAEAGSHQRAHCNAQTRFDQKAPLKGSGGLAHILTYWGGVGRLRGSRPRQAAGRWRYAPAYC